MSFTLSDLTSGSFTTSLSGTRGIATQFSGGNGILYNSVNSGANWTLRITVVDVNFSSIALSGLNGIAGGINTTSNSPVIYWTADGGVNWTATASSLGSTINTIIVSISGTKAIAGLTTNGAPSDCSAYYSGDGGVTWAVGFTLATGTSESINNVVIDGSTAIVTTFEGVNSVLRNSTDAGATWNIRLTLSFTLQVKISLSGANAIYCGQSGANGVIQYSSDNGTTWSIPTTTPGLPSNLPRAVSISGSVGIIGGVNGTTGFIWYTSDGGNTWTNSNPIIPSITSVLNYASISASGVNSLAAINTTTGGTGYLYYSTNSGQSWTLSNSLASTTINNAVLSGSNAIAGTSAGIYYTSSPLCYEANTLILTVENEEEVYKKVSELKVGDLVKTYKQGYKKINLLRSFSYKPLDKNNELNLLYKHKENGVILTAGHSILVDELTEQEKINNKKYRFSQTIEDKKLLLACSSDKFEKIDDDQEYHLYHFSLESDEPKAHFGVYINDGLLSESCSEEALLRMF
jgi:photosystem II stability/assembly factor-like uncharacterized protein